MKKSKNVKLLVSLFAVLLLFSCSDNIQKEEINELSPLSPPKWIQGGWEYNGIVYKVYFNFTPDDVIFALPYGSVTSFSDLYEDENYAIE